MTTEPTASGNTAADSTVPETSSVITTFSDGVARLTLDNPRRKNAISLSMAAAIDEFCDRVTDDPDIGAVVVDAAGQYFCSGADTRDLASSSSDPASPEAVSRTSAVYGAFVRVGSLPVPTISVVVGGAVGAGLNLAMATDVLLTTPDSVLDSGFLARSIHPGGGHLSLLGRAVGWSTTIALAACGQHLTGTEAVARGLAYAAVPVDELPALVDSLTGPAARDPELTRRIMTSARLELGPPAVSWSSALEIERGVQMWSMSRKGKQAWSSRGPQQ
ncbi:enoyl-CoA hydratase-related protein [Gordonia westfalica]|uniref:Enoyl-CoA hydratase-related protein n=1 Tax=Gordonia westfalica TaxID=158898 RepID=A0ABU2GYG2_9ACTN|nr:enoyl-CoA hydratase-related protein [Gordonia westfalica]MDS1116495.1 enoyl-CoA hydratase-related protein [Gordonia westfalica]